MGLGDRDTEQDRFVATLTKQSDEIARLKKEVEKVKARERAAMIEACAKIADECADRAWRSYGGRPIGATAEGNAAAEAAHLIRKLLDQK